MFNLKKSKSLNYLISIYIKKPQITEIVPVTYNSGSTISGTTQVGELAAGTSPKGYTLNPGGLIWWATPNTENNFVIAHISNHQ